MAQPAFGDDLSDVMQSIRTRGEHQERERRRIEARRERIERDGEAPASAPRPPGTATRVPEPPRRAAIPAPECPRCGRDSCAGDCGPRLLLPAVDFLRRASTAPTWLVPQLVPDAGTLMLHGRPRGWKSWTLEDTAVACALGEAPLRMERLRPARALRVAYVCEEDSAGMLAGRLHWLLAGRGADTPGTLFLVARSGLNLQVTSDQARLLAELEDVGAELVCLDTARALAPGIDQGPAEGAAFVHFVRSILRPGRGVALAAHDTKPGRDGVDNRPRAERASGGALLAAVDCPVGAERLGDREGLLVPSRYKVGADPCPIRIDFQSATQEGDFREWVRIVGTDAEQGDGAARAEAAVLAALTAEWSRTLDLVKASGARREHVLAALSTLVEDGRAEMRVGPRGARDYRLMEAP